MEQTELENLLKKGYEPETLRPVTKDEAISYIAETFGPPNAESYSLLVRAYALSHVSYLREDVDSSLAGDSDQTPNVLVEPFDMRGDSSMQLVTFPKHEGREIHAVKLISPDPKDRGTINTIDNLNGAPEVVRDDGQQLRFRMGDESFVRIVAFHFGPREHRDGFYRVEKANP